MSSIYLMPEGDGWKEKRKSEDGKEKVKIKNSIIFCLVVRVKSKANSEKGSLFFVLLSFSRNCFNTLFILSSYFRYALTML